MGIGKNVSVFMETKTVQLQRSSRDWELKETVERYQKETSEILLLYEKALQYLMLKSEAGQLELDNGISGKVTLKDGRKTGWQYQQSGRETHCLTNPSQQTIIVKTAPH